MAATAFPEVAVASQPPPRSTSASQPGSGALSAADAVYEEYLKTKRGLDFFDQYEFTDPEFRDDEIWIS